MGAKRELRRDVYAFNSSSVMLLAGRSHLGQGIDTDSEEWAALAREGRVWGVDFGSDASIYLRVVVGGELDAQEGEEWVGRLETRLSLPDGQLVVVGGIELCIEEQDPEDIVDGGDVRVLAVPAGEYRAELLAYLTSPIGEELLGRVKPKSKEKLGAWCRRTRPGAELPAWLRARCIDEPELDPGHEDEWRGRRGREVRSMDFVLRLTPMGGTPPPPLALDELGFVPLSTFSVRRPERCPLGLAPVDLHGAEEEADEEDEAEEGRAPSVSGRTAGQGLAVIAGGPVVVPAAALTRVARLGWFGHERSHPELRVELPAGAAVPAWPRVPYAQVAKESGGLKVTFEIPGGGNPFEWELGNRGALEGIGKKLAELPEGTLVELTCAPPRGAGDAGVIRLRGPLGKAGWAIREAFPARPAERWQAALALSAEVDKGKSLGLQADEVDEIEAWADESSYLFDGNQLIVKGKKASLEEASPGQLGCVARKLFGLRFAEDFAVATDDED